MTLYGIFIKIGQTSDSHLMVIDKKKKYIFVIFVKLIYKINTGKHRKVSVSNKGSFGRDMGKGRSARLKVTLSMDVCWGFSCRTSALVL